MKQDIALVSSVSKGEAEGVSGYAEPTSINSLVPLGHWLFQDILTRRESCVLSIIQMDIGEKTSGLSNLEVNFFNERIVVSEGDSQWIKQANVLLVILDQAL